MLAHNNNPHMPNLCKLIANLCNNGHSQQFANDRHGHGGLLTEANVKDFFEKAGNEILQADMGLRVSPSIAQESGAVAHVGGLRIRELR